MKVIKLTKKPNLKNPVLVAAWPGMGDVAIKAALFLKAALKAQEFAEVLPANFFHPAGISIKAGVAHNPALPIGKFYYYLHPKGGSDLVIFVSEAQPFIDRAYPYACAIIDFVAALKVKFIYTFAAMPSPIEHTDRPKVSVIATKKSILDSFVKMKLSAMSSGQISGLNGLLLGAAKHKKIDGVCLLGEIPLYTVQIENPLASMAVLGVLSQALKLPLDLSVFKKQAEKINGEIENLIEYLKGPSQEEKPIDQREIDIIKKGLANSSTLPESAKSRINDLFEAARRDLSRAIELKKELDHWNIYEQYEDRFLGLFKKPKKKVN